MNLETSLNKMIALRYKMNQNFSTNSSAFNFLRTVSTKHLGIMHVVENLLMPRANNKGADQPTHPCSLISIFAVVHYL